MLKTGIPYVLMIGLLILTLCTRSSDQPSAAETQSVQAVDSLATELESAVEEVETEAEETEKAIEDLLEDI